MCVTRYTGQFCASGYALCMCCRLCLARPTAGPFLFTPLRVAACPVILSLFLVLAQLRQAAWVRVECGASHGKQRVLIGCGCVCTRVRSAELAECHLLLASQDDMHTCT